MIIEALIDVAGREGLSDTLSPPGHGNHLALRLTKKGEARVEVRKDSPVRLPWSFNRTSGVRPNLLTESLKRLTETKHREASAALHARWAAKCSSHPAAQAVTRFFESPMPKLDIPKSLWGAPVVFYYGDDDRPICELPELYEAIAETLREEFPTASHPSHYDDETECVLVPHGKVKPTGLRNPQALVGFDKNSMWAAGFEKKQRMLHAGMSYTAMRQYVGGLTWVLQHRELRTPPTRGETLSYYGWAKTRHRLEERLQLFLAGCPKDTKLQDWIDQLHEMFDRDKELLEDQTPFYLLSLLCSNKIAVRDFQVTTVAELTSHLITFLDDFSIETSKGTQWVAVTPYWVLSQTLPPGGKSKKAAFPVSLVEAFYNAMFVGTRYPPVLLRAALSTCAEAITASAIPSNPQFPPTITQATLNAFISRQENTMDSKLPQDDNPFFVLGRLFGLYETRNFWTKTREEVNGTTRRFKRFCRHPGRVLPSLRERTEVHILKLTSQKSPRFVEREADLHKRLEQLLQGAPIPDRASLSDQNWIGRGRHAERSYLIEERKRKKAELAAKKEAKKEAEKKSKIEEARKRLERLDTDASATM